MGYYIQTKEDLNKAGQLLAAHPEVREVDRTALRFDPTRTTVLVCVVQNGPFDAAGICYSWGELCAFALADSRPRRWLVFPRELVIKLNPEVEPLLASRAVPRARRKPALAFYRSDKVLPSDRSFCPPGGKCARQFLLWSEERGYELASWEDEPGEFYTESGRSVLLEGEEPFLWAPLPEVM
jgi:hypothetical protein